MNRAARIARTHRFEVTFSCGAVAEFTATASGVEDIAAAWSAEQGHGVVSDIRAL